MQDQQPSSTSHKFYFIFILQCVNDLKSFGYSKFFSLDFELCFRTMCDYEGDVVLCERFFRAGSAASSNVEDIADAAVKSARDNLNRAKASFGDLMGKGNSKVRGKISDASTSTSNQTFQLGDASIVVNVAKMNASTAVDNAKDALSVLGDKLTGNDANNEASNVQSKASSAISGAKSNLPSIPFSSREEGRPEVLDACRALKT